MQASVNPRMRTDAREASDDPGGGVKSCLPLHSPRATIGKHMAAVSRTVACQTTPMYTVGSQLDPHSSTENPQVSPIVGVVVVEATASLERGTL